MSITKVGDFEFHKSIRKMRHIKPMLPRLLGNDAKNFFLASYNKGGFTDVTFEPWTPRWKRLKKRTSRNGKLYTPHSTTARERATLVGAGHLKDSVDVLRADFNHTVIGTRGVEYAAAHNDGLGKMPKRKFIGDSRQLTRKLKKRIENELRAVFK